MPALGLVPTAKGDHKELQHDLVMDHGELEAGDTKTRMFPGCQSSTSESHMGHNDLRKKKYRDCRLCDFLFQHLFVHSKHVSVTAVVCLIIITCSLIVEVNNSCK